MSWSRNTHGALRLRLRQHVAQFFLLSKINRYERIKIIQVSYFGQVRTIVVNAQVLFAATDVAKCLGYANPKDAVIRHCKSDGVVFCDLIDTMGRNQKAKFITKGNVIRLVASSELPQAKKVESWIFDEVIPSVLETGGYIATKNDDTPEEIMARALTIAQATLEKREERLKQLEADNAAKDETIYIQAEQIKESAPKVKVYNDYISSSGTYTATQIAKEYGWGAETLNRKLKEMGIQYKQNGQWLLYAKYDGNNYTRSIPRTYTKSDGVIGTQMQTVWTSKGREFIHEILPL